MDSPLKNIFKSQIEAKTGFDFEDFVNELFLLKCGAEGFTVVRRVKDEGSDGIIIVSKTILACYGPKKYAQGGFKKKAKEDFESYSQNWKKTHPKWGMVMNHSLSPYEIKYVRELQKGSVPLGIDALLHIIENDLTTYQQRQLAKSLDISSDYFRQNYLGAILEDLIKETKIDASAIATYSREDLTEITKKIELNYTNEDVALAMDEYEDYVIEVLPKISSLLKNFDDSDKEKLKSKIRADYLALGGDFKTRLNKLIERYLEKLANEDDDDFRYYIRAVLIYHFEQCIIGTKTAKGK